MIISHFLLNLRQAQHQPLDHEIGMQPYSQSFTISFVRMRPSFVQDVGEDLGHEPDSTDPDMAWSSDHSDASYDSFRQPQIVTDSVGVGALRLRGDDTYQPDIEQATAAGAILEVPRQL